MEIVLATGWTRAQLLAQPADLVSRLVWRLWAASAWDRGAVAAARADLPPGTTDPSARIAKGRARQAAAALERDLFPEG